MRAVCELSAYARCVLSVRAQRAGLLCVLGGRAARPIDLRPATARRPPPSSAPGAQTHRRDTARQLGWLCSLAKLMYLASACMCRPLAPVSSWYGCAHNQWPRAWLSLLKGQHSNQSQMYKLDPRPRFKCTLELNHDLHEPWLEPSHTTGEHTTRV